MSFYGVDLPPQLGHNYFPKSFVLWCCHSKSFVPLCCHTYYISNLFPFIQEDVNTNVQKRSPWEGKGRVDQARLSNRHGVQGTGEEGGTQRTANLTHRRIPHISRYSTAFDIFPLSNKAMVCERVHIKLRSTRQSSIFNRSLSHKHGGRGSLHRELFPNRIRSHAASLQSHLRMTVYILLSLLLKSRTAHIKCQLNCWLPR